MARGSTSSNGASSAVIAIVAVATVFGWLGSLGIGAIEQNWTPLSITTPVMLILAGYAFGIRITRANGGARDNSGEGRSE